jgi:hypothetical protein
LWTDAENNYQEKKKHDIIIRTHAYYGIRDTIVSSPKPQPYFSLFHTVPLADAKKKSSPTTVMVGIIRGQ